jgi:TPR repeat protein
MISLIMTTLLALAARIALQRPARAMASGQESPNLLQEAAEAGDREAMYHLGWALENGRGLEADPLQAASWYRRAADEGHDQAAAGLERVLATDDHRDALYMAEDREAFDHDLSMVPTAPQLSSLMRKLSPLGEVRDEAMVERDGAKLLEGVKAREPELINQLATLYGSKMIQTEDPDVTARWYRRAAVRGVPKAMVAHALFLMRDHADNPQDLMEARRFLRKGAADGNALSKFTLWKLHEKSPSLVPFDEAFASLREAVKAEDPLAQIQYGLMLQAGRHVPRNVELGRSYIKKAKKTGLSIKKEIRENPSSGGMTDPPKTDPPKTEPPKTRSPKAGSTKKTKGSKRKKRR